MRIQSGAVTHGYRSNTLRDGLRTADDEKPFLFRQIEALPSEFRLNRLGNSVKLNGQLKCLPAGFYTAGRPTL